jgi:methionine-rich copper-binding protein CopC
MKTFIKLPLSLFVLSALGQAPAWAHASLESAEPAKDVALTAAPKEVKLHFNENLEANFSSIKVIDGTGKNVVTKKAVVDAADPKTLHVPVDSLKAGKYLVQWVGVGHDGHRRTGNYGFTVK